MAQLLELSIERPAFGGAGLARLEGRVAFVEGGLPGSRVLARVVKDDPRCLRAVAEQVLEPSPHAVEPFCPHYGPCGGCSWQDAAYEAQLDWKRQIVAEQLERLAGLTPPVDETVPSPLTRGYRNKMEFAFGPGPTLGLRGRFDPSRIVEVCACGLMPAPAMALVAAVRAMAAKTQLPPYFGRTGTGTWRHLVLRASETTGRWLAQIIVGPKAPFKRLRPLCEALMRDCPDLDGLVLGVRADRADIAQAEHRAFTLGNDFLEESLDGLALRVGIDSFFQTNTRAAALLYARAAEAAALAPGETAWDLCCGAGGLSLFLARTAGRVTGFEISQAAVEDAQANAAANGLTNCFFQAGDVKLVLARRKDIPHAAVLDPPRAGLDPKALQALAQARPPRVVYVSCNPSTLARDLGRLAPAYRVERVTPVDLFPHTPHIECVARLTRAD
ncbi:23S rRNA (uracil-C(5))-methyltransferase RlmCD [Fundidesulfovibrio magnetotacticus]|uniref:23S rRNA (Uracil-C(5))-methyltransferase RlmCD n=1 Tax=Fundidesulfovibrio magnetotacticus TaxID=2730080 RepID=A0A6V8LSA4_9BACT|nr:23S rRNA (uracil(1939)-C(5))-methyltransferase RlmD [Fundidesulfovibrio magnetotacticus]GFK93451.1 23S rRNA (uracil-C(5))-methyltransferase RlmCD [Fundidesulfovibrio magnetotacticus]